VWFFPFQCSELDSLGVGAYMVSLDVATNSEYICGSRKAESFILKDVMHLAKFRTMCRSGEFHVLIFPPINYQFGFEFLIVLVLSIFTLLLISQCKVIILVSFTLLQYLIL